MLRFLTAGESHGPALTVILDGLPSGLDVPAGRIDADLKRRQGGYGRGGRMSIEKDRVRLTGGVRHGRTIGGPVAMIIENLDWPNWSTVMAIEPPGDWSGGGGAGDDALRRVRHPRPGHADLAGALKHGTHDARDVLERASARETASRVAAGAVARLLMERFGCLIASHTLAVGDIEVPDGSSLPWERVSRIPEDAPMRCADASVEREMQAEVDRARAAQDSLGGVVQVIARGVPPGLGSCRQWDTRLEARLGMALLSIQAVKGVEIGDGVASSRSRGSQVHDEIHYDRQARRFHRTTNRAGGIEGGMSNGEEIRATAYLKPLSTLPRPLGTVDLVDKTPAGASVERTDTCVVPAAGVVVEAMTALVICSAFLEKFGGDSVAECERNVRGYLQQLEAF